jgi:hypothetical protein
MGARTLSGMSLSERLAAAARARGEHVEIPARRPEPEPEPVERRLLIMGATQPVTAVDPDPAADPDSVCPVCGRTGDLAVVDLARRTTDYCCGTCNAMWRVAMPVSARRAAFVAAAGTSAGGDFALVDD